MKSVMKRMMVMVVIVAVLVVQMPGEATAAARPMEMALNYTTVLVKLHGKCIGCFLCREDSCDL